jgi:hypothetical protein
MTQEQKPTVEKIEKSLSDWYNMVNGGMNESIFFDKHELLLGAILTQALEIAKGDKVVVPRIPTDRMVTIGTEAKMFGHCAENIYEAMIAVAEGE